MSPIAEHVRTLNEQSATRFPGGDVPTSILDARADLLAALEGLDLTSDEERVAQWLFTWDQPTLHAVAGILRAAKAAKP